jgi:glycosyltransferase involved in cell wall biosynthesis
MKIYPKISVVTPSYNQGYFIKSTIDSVLCQNYPNLEYIIIDGGSTDDTISILHSYDGRLIWISEHDNGQSDALNKGLHLVTGDIISYINSDDLFESNSFFCVAEYFLSNPNAMWVTGKCRVIDENNLEIRRWITLYKNFWLLFRNYRILLILDYISQPSTFWKSSILNNIGYFDETLTHTMDYDYWLRIGNKYPLFTINKVLSSFRIHSKSKTSSFDQFITDEEGLIIKKYTKSKFIISIHSLHRKIQEYFYRAISSQE